MLSLVLWMKNLGDNLWRYMGRRRGNEVISGLRLTASRNSECEAELIPKVGG